METVASAAVVKQNASKLEIEAANKFVEYLTQPEQQKVLVKYGFRPAIYSIDILSVANSPWSQNIPVRCLILDVTNPKTLFHVRNCRNSENVDEIAAK